MINLQQFDRSAGLVRLLLEVREGLNLPVPPELGEFPEDPLAVETVDGVIHRLLSRLVDQAGD